jgi:hypothetical protein
MPYMSSSSARYSFRPQLDPLFNLRVTRGLRQRVDHTPWGLRPNASPALWFAGNRR